MLIYGNQRKIRIFMNGKECYLKAKTAFDSVIKMLEPELITKSREFLFECARTNDWKTAKFFLDEFCDIEFPLEKLNLDGHNNDTVFWICASEPGFGDCDEFVGSLDSYCMMVPDLLDRSDEYYCNQHVYATDIKVVAEQIENELILH